MWSSRPSWMLFQSPNLHPSRLPRRSLHLTPVTPRSKLKLTFQRRSPLSNGNRLTVTRTAAQTTSSHVSRPKQLSATRSVFILSSDFRKVFIGRWRGIFLHFNIIYTLSVYVLLLQKAKKWIDDDSFQVSDQETGSPVAVAPRDKPSRARKPVTYNLDSDSDF